MIQTETISFCREKQFDCYFFDPAVVLMNDKNSSDNLHPVNGLWPEHELGQCPHQGIHAVR